MNTMIKTIQSAQENSAVTHGRKSGASRNITSDPFLAIIEGMLESAAGKEELSLPMPEVAEDETLMEAFAAMLGASAQPVQQQGDWAQLIEGGTARIDAGLPAEQAVLPTQPPQTETAEPQVQTLVLPELKMAQPILSGRDAKATAQTETSFASMISETADAVDLPAEEIVSATWTAQETSPQEQELPSLQRRLFDAIHIAKSKLPQSDAKTAETTIPDLTVQPLSTSEIRFSALSKAAEDGVQDVPLLEQLDTGMKQNISRGKSEFTMTLRPEALGEITVKLTEEAGKKTLRILTSGTRSAQLINHELAALREAMKPMEIQVQEAVPKTQESGAFSQQFNFSGQQFGQQHQQAPNQAQQAHGRQSVSFEEELTETAEPALEQDGMNIYV